MWELSDFTLLFKQRTVFDSTLSSRHCVGTCILEKEQIKMTFVLTRLGDNLSLAYKCKGTYNYKHREMLTGKK